MVNGEELVRTFTPEAGIRVIELVDFARYNALSADMVSALKRAFAAVASERETRVVILRGAPDGRGFCAGADMSGGVDPAAASGFSDTKAIEPHRHA